MNRVLVFLLYDPDGICDQSVLHTLRGFRPYASRIVVVVNGELTEPSRSQLAGIVDDVIQRENIGFDVGAYREALSYLGWNKLAEIDELLLVNYTFFGPVGSFAPLFERMDGTDVDFWGITNHPAVTPNPFTGKGTMPEHLQSFWLAVRKNMLASSAFQEYWDNLPTPMSYSEIVVQFESEFTHYFSSRGYSWIAAFPAGNFGVLNPTMEAPINLLKAGCPLFKKRLYFHDVPALVAQGVSTAEVTRVAVELGFPREIIVEGVRRRATTRELTIGIDATYVVPVSSGQPEGAPSRRVLRSRPWRLLASGEGLYPSDGDDNQRTDVVVIDPAELEVEASSDGNLLRYKHARDALMGDDHSIPELFASNSRLAALFPYPQTLEAPVSGRKWFTRVQTAEKVAKSIGLVGPFSYSSIVAPYRGMAAYRQEFLQKVADRISQAGGWRHISEIAGGEQPLVRILDCLAGDIAREEGMFVGIVATGDELRTSWNVMQDVYSRKPIVYPDYADYPYSGRVVAPTIKNRIGQAIKGVSPSTFDRLYRLQLRVHQSIKGR